jgi:hypothetical protein
MKFNPILSICFGILIAACQGQKESADHHHDSTAAKDTVQPDTIKKSIPKEEHAQIAGTHFTIKYHAPAVRGRTIWGGLVPYDDVWVTGAHAATSLEFDKDIIITDTRVPAGKYALFTIPGKDKWVIIVNKNWDQHLADEYDAKDDVVRVDVVPEALSSIQERLKYSIVSEGESKASLNIAWEKVKVSLPIQLN